LIEPRAATADELADWDRAAVDAPGGHVYQSRGWAEHRAQRGWRPWFVAWDDGVRALALTRPWPIVGGAGAYVPRGPRPEPGAGARTAERLVGLAGWLADRGVDVVAADPEVPASDRGFGAGLTAGGFRAIEELQPSRHRVTRPLRGLDEDSALAAIAKSTRQRIRRAEKDGVRVVRHDRCDGGELPGGTLDDGFEAPAEDAAAALDRFYTMLLATGERRSFSFGPRDEFVPWWRRALADGHLVFLEAWPPTAARRDGHRQPLAGLILYRHGDRLSTVHSADRAETRREHPGALHLLRWRAMQLALREGRAELDLGGVDVEGQRREPRPGEPMWGLYEHKRSFGGEWLELAGAHERIVNERRYLVGRVAQRLVRVADRTPLGRLVRPPSTAR
jgi:lipid II:glycine glycyltransferase (peptidoglycan interpeptide bridge formation enzyme)